MTGEHKIEDLIARAVGPSELAKLAALRAPNANQEGGTIYAPSERQSTQDPELGRNAI